MHPKTSCARASDLKAIGFCFVEPYLFFRYGHFYFQEDVMENRIAVMGIIVEDVDSVEALNSVLHDYGAYIIGRMGIPYRDRGLNIVSIAIDAPQDVIAALSGKIGNIEGISVKTAYSNKIYKD